MNWFDPSNWAGVSAEIQKAVFQPLPGGHIGVFVSDKSQGVLGKGISKWLKAR